ncbi:MAG: GntR family transcriptional regulator [Actinocatenispora sp.]
MTGFAPVGRESTASIIARRLRAAISDGGLPPGAQLGEAELASSFQVSRGTLREAMQRLVEEGLVDGERHRGLFVRELSAEDVQDVYVTRNAIEQAAAQLILRGDRDAIADELDLVYQEMCDAIERGDQVAVGQTDVRFHELLVARSGSRRLMRMARTLLIETRMCIRALQGSYEMPEDLAREHSALVTAIRNGNRALVLGLIDAHMEDAVQRLAPGRTLHTPMSPGVDGMLVALVPDDDGLTGPGPRRTGPRRTVAEPARKRVRAAATRRAKRR